MGYVFPVVGQWRWGGGVEEHRKRPLGNWQSDNAVDIMAPAGSLYVSPVSGRVVKISGSDPRQGVRGTLFGRSVTIQDAQGRQWFGTHLDNPLVRVGQFVTAGSPIARLGDWGDNSHLHLGVSDGDPRALVSGSPSVAATLPATATTAGAGCLPMLLAQVALVTGMIYAVARGVMLL